MTFDKSKPAYWEDIKTDNIITLKDEQGIEDSMEQDKGVGGLDYTVKSIKNVSQVDDLCSWIIYELESPEQSLWLVAKIVDGDVEVAIYFDMLEFPPGSRSQMLEDEMFWLFQEPESDEFDPSDLLFSKEIFLDHQVDDEIEECNYQIKPQGQLFGKCRTSPKQSGIGDTLMTVVEYSTGDECENPEFLILEEGAIPQYEEDEDEEGGWVTLLLGCKTRMSEIDVL